jgi:hypothetical protein
MREVRIQSLEAVEMAGEEVRLSANAGELGVVFPKSLWENVLSGSLSAEPSAEELEELWKLKVELRKLAREQSFNTVLEGVQCGARGLEYDLVLKPGGLYAATTGYHFTRFASAELVRQIGGSLKPDRLVEQAYVIGAVVDDDALAAGDDNIKVLSVRGRRCGASRFELPPELWRTLSGRLGWEDVKTP